MADLLARRALYTRTSKALTDLDDDQFAAAIGDRPPGARRGWGDSYRAEICGFPVFVKLIYIVLFAAWTTRHHDGLGTHAFDLGIFDQGSGC